MSSPSFYVRLQNELQEIKDAGLFKQERIIESEQGAEITVNGREGRCLCVLGRPYFQCVRTPSST